MALGLYVFRENLSKTGIQSLINSFNTRKYSHGDIIAGISLEAGSAKASCAFIGKLAVLSSSSNLYLSDIYGNSIYKSKLSYSSPIMTSSDKYIMVYDREKYNFSVFDDNKLVHSGTSDSPILYASVNNSGYSAIVVNEPGYRAAVSLYSKSFERLYKCYTSTYYISSAYVSPNGKGLAAACMSEKDDEFSSTLLVYDISISDAAPIAEISLQNSYILNVTYIDAERLCIITESSVLFYSSAGELIGSHQYNGIFYGYISKEGKLPIIAVSDYSSGSFLVQQIGTDGSPVKSFRVSGDLKGMSAFGGYTAIGADDTIHILDAEFSECCSPIEYRGLNSFHLISKNIIGVLGSDKANIIKI